MDEKSFSITEKGMNDKILTKRDWNELTHAQHLFDELMEDATKNLRDNYEYQFSDESIIDTINANDWRFDEYGDIA